MIPPWLVDGRTLRTLSRCLVTGAVVCGIGVSACMARTYWAATKLNQNKAREAKAKKELPAILAAISSAQKLVKPLTPDPKQACTDFQTAVEQAANRFGAQIPGFNTSPEVLLYLSKYTNESPPEGWKQVSMNFSIFGTAQSVFDTLGELKKTDIPFEIDVLDINRTSSDNSGESTVTAQIQARVLMRA